MVCIYCEGNTKVTNSRTSVKGASTWRRRECLRCGSIVTTRENVDYEGAVRVRKKTARLEPFKRDKLLISLHNSLSHRKTALTDATQLTDTVIQKLAHLHTNGVLDTAVIIESAHAILSRFDPAAGVHYQAHHS